MALRQKRPMTPGQRFQVVDTFEDITENKPEKSLLVPLKKRSGRDASGRISMRHRGGGSRQFLRVIDFKRLKDDIPAKVLSIEYDPLRNARIALLQYRDGEKRYIIAPVGVKVGDTLMSGLDVEIRPGNTLPLRHIPVGTGIHNVELKRGRGGQIARGAGTGVQLLAKEGNYAILKLPSGEQRMVHLDCRATVGQVGNIESKNIVYGKAGRKRHLGIRPHVRGVVMNPCDHPHGGGEGKSGIGRKHPVSPWGQPALGYKTRKKRRRSERFILARRK